MHRGGIWGGKKRPLFESFQLPDHRGVKTWDDVDLWLTPLQLLQNISRKDNDDANVENGRLTLGTINDPTNIGKLSSLFADVAYYSNLEVVEEVDFSDEGDDDKDVNIPLTPSLYRLNPKLLQQDEMERVKEMLRQQTTPEMYDTSIFQEATDRIYRWCEYFVQDLNLCPWAKLSLQSTNAIRIKIIQQDVDFGDGKVRGLEVMEQIIRESALELMDLTDDDDGSRNGHVDANVGITFVVALPTTDKSHLWDFEFEQFYDFCISLEDQLLDEAEEYEQEQEFTDDSNDGTIDRTKTIGDEITIAPFHPDWSFASGEINYLSNGTNNSTRNPLDYEKKAPYPTISLVRSSVIIKAGEEATGRIGLHNEEILQEYGSKKLEQLYQEKVIRPVKTTE